MGCHCSTPFVLRRLHFFFFYYYCNSCRGSSISASAKPQIGDWVGVKPLRAGQPTASWMTLIELVENVEAISRVDCNGHCNSSSTYSQLPKKRRKKKKGEGRGQRGGEERSKGMFLILAGRPTWTKVKRRRKRGGAPRCFFSSSSSFSSSQLDVKKQTKSLSFSVSLWPYRYKFSYYIDLGISFGCCIPPVSLSHFWNWILIIYRRVFIYFFFYYFFLFFCKLLIHLVQKDNPNEISISSGDWTTSSRPLKMKSAFCPVSPSPFNNKRTTINQPPIKNTHVNLVSFQIPDRQHGPHHRRKQEQHSVRVRPGEHHLPCVHTGDARGRRWEVHHLQRIQRRVRHMSHNQSQSTYHRRVRQALQAHVLHHHLPLIHTATRWTRVQTRTGLLLHL